MIQPLENPVQKLPHDVQRRRPHERTNLLQFVNRRHGVIVARDTVDEERPSIGLHGSHPLLHVDARDPSPQAPLIFQKLFRTRDDESVEAGFNPCMSKGASKDALGVRELRRKINPRGYGETEEQEVSVGETV